jgi:integrase
MPREARPRWHKRRGCWYANIGAPDAKGRATEAYAPRSIGQKDEAAAWDWYRAEKAKRDTPVVAAVAEVTVDWVCEHYIAWAEERKNEGKLPAGEYRNKQRHLGIFCDVFGPRVVSSLTPDEVTAFGEAMLDDYAPVYVRNICASARAALNWAANPQRKHIPANPIKGFKAPTIPQSPHRFAERAEAAAFVGFWRTRTPRTDQEGGPLVASRYDRLTLLLERCLIRTGARPKELCRLKWADIKWDGWTTSAGHVCAKAVLPYTRWKAGKKTGKHRTIYFTPVLTRALRRQLDRIPLNDEWVFVHRGGRGGKGAIEPWRDGSTLSKTVRRVRGELVTLQAATRKRIEEGEPVKAWERRRAAVVVREEGDNRLVNYRWRHTAISTLLMHGVDVATVAELTGTSPDMIYKHYGHLLDSHLQVAAEKLLHGPKRSKPRAAPAVQA